MATRKATEEYFQAKGLSREAVIERIKDGRIKGEVDAKSIMIEESEWPEHLRLKAKEELTEASIERQKYLDETERVKAEVQKIRAEIDLAVAKGDQDKPEQLVQREQTILKREAEVATKLKDVDAKLSELEQREATLKVLETEMQTRRRIIDQDCAEKIKTTEETIAKSEANFEEYARKQYAQIDDLNGQIKKETAKLDGLLDIIGQYPEAIAPFVVALKKYKQLCDAYGIREYKLAEQTSGQISDRHTQLSNQGWSLSKSIDKLISWFQGA